MMIANLSTPLLGLVDTAVMGHLDHANFLASVAIAGLIFNFLFWGFGFLRLGTSGLTAQAFGANDLLEQKAILIRALCLALGISILIITNQHLIARLSFYFIHSDKTIESLAQYYFSIRIWSAPATLSHYVIIGWFLGRQNTLSPLIIIITINLCNIFLDLLFVMHYDMQTEGVALASVIAEYIGLMIGLILLLRHLSHTGRSMSYSQIFRLNKLKAMLLLNSHLLVRTLCLIFTFSFFTVQGEKLGSIILATNALLMNFQTLMAYALDGFAHASEALIGRALGAKDLPLLKRSLKTTALWSLLLALLFTLIFHYFGQALIHLLTDLQPMRTSAYQYLPWLILLPSVSFLSYLMDGVFIGATLSKQMRNSIILSLFLVFLPAWYYTQHLGNHGLWLALTLFMLARSLAMLLYFAYNKPALFNKARA